MSSEVIERTSDPYSTEKAHFTGRIFLQPRELERVPRPKMETLSFFGLLSFSFVGFKGPHGFTTLHHGGFL